MSRLEDWKVEAIVEEVNEKLNGTTKRLIDIVPNETINNICNRAVNNKQLSDLLRKRGYTKGDNNTYVKAINTNASDPKDLAQLTFFTPDVQNVDNFLREGAIGNLTLEELVALIDEYKLNQQKEAINKVDTSKYDLEIITRSVRVYKQSFNHFANFCKLRNVNQSLAIHEAITDYINKHQST